jgi:hypothetical protein
MKARTARLIRRNLHFWLNRALLFFLVVAGLSLLAALTTEIWRALEPMR